MGLVPMYSIQSQIIPSGGERWTAGTTGNIRWEASLFPVGPVDISLWDGELGKWSYIVSAPSEKGSFEWQIPMGLNGDMFRIKIQSRTHTHTVYMSESFFSITTPSPGGGLPMDLTIDTVVVAPVPASEQATVSWRGKAVALSIVDITGHKLVQIPLHRVSHYTLPVQEFLPGFYVVTVLLEDSRYLYGKLLIER